MNKLTDGAHKTPKYTDYGIPFLSVKDMSSGKVSFRNTKFISKEEHKKLYKRCDPQKGDILLSKVGTTGIPVLIDTDKEFSLFVSLALLKFDSNFINSEFLVNLINSPLVQKQCNENTKGVGNKNWVMRDIANTLIVIPPYKEQEKINNEIKKIEPLIIEYELKEIQLNKLNSEFKEKLKKSILQYAIEGKLVPQDPNDEPASVLLEQIRQEKQRLISEGKIKKDKNKSFIFRRDNSYYEKQGEKVQIIDEEILFEIPETWEWCRLSELGIYKKGPFGSSLTKSMFKPKSDSTVKVYEQKNAIQKNHILGDYYIDKDYYKSKMKGFKVDPGDIIVSCAGTIGETYVMPNNIEEGIINQALMKITLFSPINYAYFLLYFDYVIKKTAIKNSKGSAIKNIPPFGILKRILIPIPPLNEQIKIIKKLNSLLNIIQD